MDNNNVSVLVKATLAILFFSVLLITGLFELAITYMLTLLGSDLVAYSFLFLLFFVIIYFIFVKG